MKKRAVSDWHKPGPLVPGYTMVADVDLVIIRWESEDKVSELVNKSVSGGHWFSPIIL